MAPQHPGVRPGSQRAGSLPRLSRHRGHTPTTTTHHLDLPLPHPHSPHVHQAPRGQYSKPGEIPPLEEAALLFKCSMSRSLLHPIQWHFYPYQGNRQNTGSPIKLQSQINKCFNITAFQVLPETYSDFTALPLRCNYTHLPPPTLRGSSLSAHRSSRGSIKTCCLARPCQSLKSNSGQATLLQPSLPGYSSAFPAGSEHAKILLTSPSCCS